jgi:hypothetical protein
MQQRIDPMDRRQPIDRVDRAFDILIWMMTVVFCVGFTWALFQGW